MAAGGRVSIPAGARRTVADIMEISGGHTDEEVYAILRECNMDPNETAQRLLLEDTFHEVKRKCDKKKEGSKEPLDSRWRPAVQGRGGKSGRGNYSSRSLSSSNDSAGRSAISGKENGISLITGKGSGSTPIINVNMDVKASTFMPSTSAFYTTGFPRGSNQGQANVYSGANRAIPGPVGISTLCNRDSLASEFQVIPSVRQY